MIWLPKRKIIWFNRQSLFTQRLVFLLIFLLVRQNLVNGNHVINERNGYMNVSLFNNIFPGVKICYRNLYVNKVIFILNKLRIHEVMRSFPLSKIVALRWLWTKELLVFAYQYICGLWSLMFILGFFLELCCTLSIRAFSIVNLETKWFIFTLRVAYQQVLAVKAAHTELIANWQILYIKVFYLALQLFFGLL